MRKSLKPVPRKTDIDEHLFVPVYIEMGSVTEEDLKVMIEDKALHNPLAYRNAIGQLSGLVVELYIERNTGCVVLGDALTRHTPDMSPEDALQMGVAGKKVMN